MGYKTYTCPIGRTCGGCEWLAVPYPIQLRRKQEWTERLFEQVAREDGTELAPIVGVPGEPVAYRCKAATPFAPGPRGRVRSGFYAAGTHRIVACDECLVEDPRCRRILNEIAHTATKLRIPAYDEDRGTGLLRHAIVRVGWRTDEALLTVVTNGRELRHADQFVAELRRRCPEVTSCVQNVNTRRTNAMLGRETHVLWGSGVLADELLGCRFEVGPLSFYQTNPAQTETLYHLAIEAAGLADGDRLLDAYCGCGTIGICAAAAAREAGARVHVTGVETSADAVARARRNAELNGLAGAGITATPNSAATPGSTAKSRSLTPAGTCVFHRADATAWMARTDEHFDVIVLDPPRAGSTPDFLEGAVRLGPERIVYVSCNAETQVRDLATLHKGGYRLVRLTPVDMFPHTKHVETVALLTR